MIKSYKVYCDGGARGNPGPAASAFLVVENNKSIHEGSSFLGKATNNVAEYIAVEMAFKWLVKNIPKKSSINFFLDSRLVVNQLEGNFKVKNIKLKKIFLSIKKTEEEHGGLVNYKYIPRDKNTKADNLVNIQLDESMAISHGQQAK